MSVLQYVADPWGLASHWKFGSMEDEMIRAQLAKHTNNPKVKENLIVLSNDPISYYQISISDSYSATHLPMLPTEQIEPPLIPTALHLSPMTQI